MLAIVVLFAVCFVEAVFIGLIIKKSVGIIYELECRIYKLERKNTPAKKTVEAVQKMWEVEV